MPNDYADHVARWTATPADYVMLPGPVNDPGHVWVVYQWDNGNRALSIHLTAEEAAREAAKTGGIEETVFERVAKLLTERSWPEPRRDPVTGLRYLSKPMDPPTIVLTLEPTANERGIWATTQVTGGPIGE